MFEAISHHLLKRYHVVELEEIACGVQPMERREPKRHASWNNVANWPPQLAQRADANADVSLPSSGMSSFVWKQPDASSRLLPEHMRVVPNALPPFTERRRLVEREVTVPPHRRVPKGNPVPPFTSQNLKVAWTLEDTDQHNVTLMYALLFPRRVYSSSRP
jgi:hypothetical protein